MYFVNLSFTVKYRPDIGDERNRDRNHMKSVSVLTFSGSAFGVQGGTATNKAAIGAISTNRLQGNGQTSRAITTAVP